MTNKTGDKKKVVYIASPLTAPTKAGVNANIEYAKRAAIFAIHKGAVPFIPHLMYPSFLDDTNPEERALGIELDTQILARCDELWTFGPTVSTGMMKEMRFAVEHGITIHSFPNFE